VNDDRVEAAFRRQYRHLGEDELREIAAGDVPWVEDGVYLYAARRAARDLLQERGAENVPSVPAWDPAEKAMPSRYRLAAVACAVVLAIGAAATYRAAMPPDAPTKQQACAAASDLLTATDVGYHYKLGTNVCEVGPGDEVRPIAMRGCVTITDVQATRLLETPDVYVTAQLSRFGAKPAAGRYCAPGPRILAELVTRPGRPWFVRLKGP